MGEKKEGTPTRNPATATSIDSKGVSGRMGGSEKGCPVEKKVLSLSFWRDD